MLKPNRWWLVGLAVASCALTARADVQRIASISSECADRGERVALTGIGFGAFNARVSVGGVAATIQDATGHALTFVVPSGAPLGDTVVAVTHKNGSQSGSIPFRVGCAPLPPQGILLEGDPAASALDATRDFTYESQFPDALTSVDVDGTVRPRTRFALAIVPGATVGQVNALLESLNGRITSMLQGTLLFAVDVPDPGSLTGLEAILQRARQSPIVRYANKTTMVAVAQIPEGYTPPVEPDSDFEKIDHHLAVRAHAAWNARAALQKAPNPPTVIVGDNFGAVLPASALDALVTTPPGEFGSSPPDPDDGSRHGFHVTGIIAGSFGGTGETGLVTGIYPARSILGVVDGRKYSPKLTHDALMIQAIRTNQAERVVLNTSLGSSCAYRDSNGGLQEAAYQTCVRQETDAWLEMVRGTTAHTGGSPQASIENKFLHVTAAGNAGQDQPFFDATWTSAYTLGARQSLAALSNVLSVENRTHALDGPFVPACLNPVSRYSGDLSGIGTHVYSFFTGTTAGNLSGTSMAAPQVAGLAAFVWALDSSLTVQQLKSLLLGTARFLPGDASCVVPPRPIIDAYAAVLATDKGETNAPVRSAILDVDSKLGTGTPDGFFDDLDIDTILANLDESAGALDFSRYDLNGDGYTGGDRRAPFDLDMKRAAPGSVKYERVSQDTENGTVVTYDESAVTDLDVLCYYAYSALYSGDPESREPGSRSERLGSACAGLQGSGGVFVNALTFDPGTALLFKVRKKDGSLPQSEIKIVVEGPEGWAASAGGVREVTYPANVRRWWFTLSDAPVSGEYRARALVENTEISTRFRIDASNRPATMGEVKGTVVSSSEVTGTWPSIAGAASYVARVIDINAGSVIVPPVQFTTQNSAALKGLSLVAGQDYRLQVYSFTADMRAQETLMPPQFNVSFNRDLLQVGLSIVPKALSASPGQTVNLQAVYPSTITNRATGWTASVGTVVPNATDPTKATWISPSGDGKYTITATSVAIPDLKDTATITVGADVYCGNESARERWEGVWRVSPYPPDDRYISQECEAEPYASLVRDGRIEIVNGRVRFPDHPGLGEIGGGQFYYQCDFFATEDPPVIGYESTFLTRRNVFGSEVEVNASLQFIDDPLSPRGCKAGLLMTRP